MDLHHSQPGRVDLTRNIENCRECTKPFTKVGTALVCNDCLEIEREKQQDLYQKLSRDAQFIDFPILAKKTLLSERTLKDAMMYRLGHGGDTELVGAKKGYCYVCHARMSTMDTVEPLCIKCLERVYQVIQEEPDSVLKQGRHKQHRHGAHDHHDCTECGKPAEPTHSVCHTCYDEQVEEVTIYKKTILEAGIEVPAKLRQMLAIGDQQDEASDVINETVRNILEEDEEWTDEEASVALDNLLGIASYTDPLRHYGFKRLKNG